MSFSSDRYFNGTCDVFDLATCRESVLNDRFLDPCSCSNYYRCTQTYLLISESCAEDTLWDVDLGRCNHAHEVRVKEQCDPSVSWMRCNATDVRNQQLRHICTNSPDTTMPPITTGSILETTTMSKAPPGDNSGVNIGLVVGLIAALLVVVVLIILIVLYFRKRKMSKIQKKRSTSTHNPEYFENGNQDDPYAVIDDRMARPAHIASTITESNGGFINNAYNTMEDPTYDNSAERPQEFGYTGTLNRSFREYETAVNASSGRPTTGNETSDVNISTDVVNDDQTTLQSKRLDENGNRNSKNSKHTVDSESTGGSFPDTNSNHSNQGLDDETSPDYYVLSPTEHM